MVNLINILLLLTVKVMSSRQLMRINSFINKEYFVDLVPNSQHLPYSRCIGIRKESLYFMQLM